MKNNTLTHLRYLLVLCVITLIPSFSYAQIGKIWYTDAYLYVNIPGNGVVILNNLDPQNPQKIGYIDIAGNIDLAVRGNYLYANSHQDLLVIDVSEVEKPKEVHRIPNVFSHHNIGFGNMPSIVWNPGNSPIGEMLRRPQVRANLNSNTFGTGTNNPLISSFGASSAAPASVSKGGSMACFTLQGNYMYAIDANSLLVFDLSDPAKPIQQGNKINVGNDIETLFAYGERLYIGAQTGMSIFSIADPTTPRAEGRYRHTRSCDPVVVEGNYAYVTLRSGTECGGSINQLDVIDVSNPRNPKRVKSYNMTEPYGLGIDAGTLFVCDGRSGLKVYDAANPLNLQVTAHFRDIQTYDVIPVSHRKLLIMAGEDKIRQYSYENKQQPQLLSTFVVE